MDLEIVAFIAVVVVFATECVYAVSVAPTWDVE
jgi:hypothetical protein